MTFNYKICVKLMFAVIINIHFKVYVNNDGKHKFNTNFIIKSHFDLI